jgi:nucleoside diphosphate kinase
VTGVERASAVDPGYLRALCRAGPKRDLLAVDPYVREAWLHDGELRDTHWLWRHTFVALKPDAIAGRRASRILAAVAALGLRAVTATTVRFHPVLVREIWRYQFNAASAHRIAVVDHLLGAGPTVLVLLRDEARGELPVSVRLTAAKGPAEPSRAAGTDLRTRVGRVNGLLNFIHTADEPIDVARELMLFSYTVGTRWLRGGPERLDEALAWAAAAIPAHDLDVTASLARLAAGRDGWAGLARDSAAPEHVGAWIDRVRESPLPGGGRSWDVLTVITSWMSCNEPGIAPVVPTTSPDEWTPTAGLVRA